MTLKLNTGQRKVVLSIINDFLKQNEYHSFYITGSAGTGKTKTMAELLRILYGFTGDNEYTEIQTNKEYFIQNTNYFSKNLRVFVCALSNSATDNIKSKILEYFNKNNIDTSVKITFETLHKLLKLRPHYDNSGNLIYDGKIIFKDKITKLNKLNGCSNTTSTSSTSSTSRTTSTSSTTSTKTFNMFNNSKNNLGQTNISNDPYIPDLLIVDECSMIEKNVWKYIQKNVQYLFENNPNFKVIILGHKHQLNPVNEKISKSFDPIIGKTYKYHQRLVELMRCKDIGINTIIDLIKHWNMEESLMELFKIKNINPANLENVDFCFCYRKSADIFKKNRDNLKLTLESKWFQKYKNFLNKGICPTILAWRNSTVKFYNNLIRQQIYKKKADSSYDSNDYLIFYTWFDNIYEYGLDENNVGDSNDEIVKLLCPIEKINRYKFYNSMIKVSTNSLIKVIKVCKIFKYELFNRDMFESFKYNSKLIEKLENAKINWTFDVECLAVELVTKNSDGKVYYFLTVSHQEIDSLNESIKNASKIIEDYLTNEKNLYAQEIWEQFYEQTKKLAYINFRYSSTVHKAQGADYDAVFVDTADICDNPEKNEMKAMLYVAVGRSVNYLNLMFEKLLFFKHFNIFVICFCLFVDKFFNITNRFDELNKKKEIE